MVAEQSGREEKESRERTRERERKGKILSTSKITHEKPRRS